MRSLFFMIAVLFAFNLQGQIWEEFQENDKYGIQDYNGKVLIEAKYDAVFGNCGLRESKNDSIARVKLNDKFIFVNIYTGKEIPFQYEVTWCFTEGLAGVKFGNKWGYIDEKGKVIISAQYDDVFPFTKGFANVQLNGKWGVINKSNVLVATYKYDDVTDYFYEEGNIQGVKIGNKWGFITRNGKEIVAPKYDVIEHAYRGFTHVNIGGEKSANSYSIKGGKWGCVDSTGKEVLPLIYDEISDVNDKIAPVKQDGKWGLVDIYGKQIIPFKYDWITCFYEDRAMVKYNGKYGYIDRSDNLVIDAIYENCRPFDNGRAEVNKTGNWFYIDRNGNFAANQEEVLPEGYENTEIIEVVDVKETENGWTLITKDDDNPYPFLSENGKYGYKDQSGKIVIEAKYHIATHFEDGKAKVRKGKKEYYINKKGKKVK
ncbi:MAG: WG repeat-containing protein [Bacteroidota bacterium]